MAIYKAFESCLKFFGYPFLLILVFVSAIHLWYWVAGIMSLPSAYPIAYQAPSSWYATINSLCKPIGTVLEVFWNPRWKFVADPVLGTIQAVFVQTVLLHALVKVVGYVFRHNRSTQD